MADSIAKNSSTIREINRLARNGIPFLILVDFEMEHPLVFKLSELPGDILVGFPGLPVQEVPSPVTGPVLFKKDPIGYDDYQAAFNRVIHNALAGNTYLANLTFPTEIHTGLSLQDIFHHSHARYRLLFRNEFVVFSPEIFVRIRHNKISSYPMKGTIDADIPDAPRIIREDAKEMAEHVTIVDLIRNDLSIHASRVMVEKFRYIETLKTNHKSLLQVSSVITGELPEEWPSCLGHILFSMLPAGSVSGAPKKETLRIIREAEGSDRGFFTGIMGLFDGKDFDSAVMIRFIENRDGRFFYRSGGGLTHMSDPEKEYFEMIDKVYVPLA